ncbi:MAG: helix-turn-helix domain-containing protein [Paenarthrobacter ureafaciens]|uniref:helix-turn-helix domain-containing protein n=1 Tax=Paenarthrobacter ureafaciens TaxID=37931 RepID=UPI001AD4E5FD|nr:helix-turn-helix domain-containing protein [Paenarthrobacter ureafaciens]MBN9129187.1 helix-turn-helix domain-containing protein [Paenarthrobacter ureafaciens]
METTGLWLERIEAGIADDDLSKALDEALARHEITARAAQAARNINALLRGQRQREDLLRALHDTATDLTGIRDVEAVLLAIVKRTRVLAGSDMSYISLNDYDQNETYIRKSDGVATEDYRTIRMPIGTGVLGKAAAGLAPYQTTDYLTDDGLSRLPHIDAIVAKEGVRAILGVPLQIYGRVIGALLIADRRPRTYPPELVDLVDTVAKHAAVAIDNARRFADAASALQRLGNENRTRLEEMGVLQSLIDLDERFIEVVVQGNGLEGFAALSRQILGTDVLILDAANGVLEEEHGTSLQQGGVPFSATLMRDDGRRALASGVVQALASGRPYAFTVAQSELVLITAKAGSTHLATLVARGPFTDSQRTIAERLAVFLTVLRLFDQAMHDSAQRLQFEVLDDLLSDRDVPLELIQQRAARFGVPPAGGMTVAVFDSGGADYARVEKIIREGLGPVKALIARRGSRTYLLASGSRNITQSVMTRLKESNVPATAGHASTANGLAGIKKAHRQAELALSSLLVLGRKGELLDGNHLGNLGLLLNALHSNEDQEDFYSQIEPLIKHDTLHNTELTRTAWTFLETNHSIARTAEGLFIHRNTVKQRLERIALLMGGDWLDSTRQLDIHLCLRIWHLQTAGSAGR